MADLLTTIIGSPIAARLGVPQPTPLRRYEPGAPICDGPVLVTGGGRFTDGVAEWVEGRGVPTVSTLEEAGERKLGAIVLDLSAATSPTDLDVLQAVGAPAVRMLRGNARVIVIGSDPADLIDITAAATHRALEGFVRSLAKELRAGATANLLLAQEGSHDGVRSGVGFFLSGRSAYVDGQAVRVGEAAGANVDLARPLTGKVAVVTGAARGIGTQIAQVLARDGATIVAVDIPAAGDALAAVANDIKGTALQLDVTAADAGTAIVDHATSRHGSLDIVVHNAGITRDKLLVNMDERRWGSVIDVNLHSILRMNETILGDGGLRDGGRIVCVASIAGIAGNRGQTNYGASKAGVIGLVTALSKRVKDRGITVNAVAPGFIETEMTAKVPFATRELGRRMNSLQQGGRPKDVAETIAWFSQPGAAAVTGQVLRVCGQSLLGA